jgi:Lrp/AsnC family leucine-responsive transcriptional regulator
MVNNAKLDRTDARILEVLQRDGRRPYAEIGADVGISGPSAHERVKKLEARGIIRGYAAQVDPQAVGLDILAFAWVTQSPGTVATDLTGEFAAVAEIEECHHMAGEADYLLKVRARDIRHLDALIHTIQAIPNVFRTVTDVALSTAFERRAFALVDETAGAAEA